MESRSYGRSSIMKFLFEFQDDIEHLDLNIAVGEVSIVVEI